MTGSGRTRVALAGAVSLATVSGAAIAAAPFATASPDDPMQAARAASARFHSVEQADKAGYVELADKFGNTCIASSAGGMGVHYVNGALLADPAIDPAAPEALVYEPQPDGSLKLVALEYLVLEPALAGPHPILNPDDLRIPRVLGQKMLRVPGIDEGGPFNVPAFFERHLWLWEDNPAGDFADWNPEVSCP